MKGAIIGDIVGSIYEWHNIKTKDFPLFAPNCSFTDDSIMTLAVGRAFLNCTDEADSPEELVYQMRLFGHMYPHGGYGGRFKQWLRAEEPHPYNSFGNGAAMRCSPRYWASATPSASAGTATPSPSSPAASRRATTAYPTRCGSRRGSSSPSGWTTWYVPSTSATTSTKAKKTPVGVPTGVFSCQPPCYRPFKRWCLLCSVCRKSR